MDEISKATEALLALADKATIIITREFDTDKIRHIEQAKLAEQRALPHLKKAFDIEGVKGINTSIKANNDGDGYLHIIEVDIEPTSTPVKQLFLAFGGR